MTLTLGIESDAPAVLAVGDQLGLTIHGKAVDFWCEIFHLSGTIARCSVINGNWNMDVDLNLGITLTPYTGVNVCWTGRAPFQHVDYRKALEWIAAQCGM